MCMASMAMTCDSQESKQIKIIRFISFGIPLQASSLPHNHLTLCADLGATFYHQHQECQPYMPTMQTHRRFTELLTLHASTTYNARIRKASMHTHNNYSNLQLLNAMIVSLEFAFMATSFFPLCASTSSQCTLMGSACCWLISVEAIERITLPFSDTVHGQGLHVKSDMQHLLAVYTQAI